MCDVSRLEVNLGSMIDPPNPGLWLNQFMNCTFQATPQHQQANPTLQRTVHSLNYAVKIRGFLLRLVAVIRLRQLGSEQLA